MAFDHSVNGRNGAGPASAIGNQKTRLAIFIIAMFISSIAGAEEMTLRKSADPVVHQYPGHALDVLGVVPGMSAYEARKRIAAEYDTDPSETETALTLRYRSVSMSTQSYVSELRAGKDDDRIIVYLGTPATGAL